MTEIVNQLIYGVLALVALSFWWRLRSTPAAWLAATFGSLALVILQGLLVPEVDPADQPLPQFSALEIYIDVVIIALFSFPYLLHRFARSLKPTPIFGSVVLDVTYVGLIIATIAAPGFPPPGEQPTGWVAIYFFVLLAFFGIPLAQSAWVLWRLGRGESGVVSNRMRLMSVASGLMTVAVMVSFLSDPAAEEPALLPTLLGWLSAGSFLLAFQPPPPLRRLWRAHEEEALRNAEHGLLSADTAQAAAESVIQIAPALVGGAAAAIYSADGELLASHGPVGALPADAQTPAGRGELRIDGETVRVRILPNSTTPVFGRGEEALLGQLAGHLDLAMRRLEALRAAQDSLERAQRANEELHQLVYGISHDLRNPLVTILGFLGVFDADGHEGLTEQQKLARDRIGVSAAYMESLVEDLLQLSRVGRMDAETANVDIPSLIEDVATDVTLGEDEITVSVEGEGAAWMNPVRARQLFTNLIVNAARHAGVRPLSIVVRLQQADERLGVEVVDNGVGIPREDHEKVFRIFQRLQGFDSSAKGSGIGLTMCRRIVEEVDGDITIADTESGTTFVMTLPTLSDQPATARDNAVSELA